MLHMIKKLARSIREYKKPAILTPFLVTGEVILECIIPFIIANLVNQMQAGCDINVIVTYGIELVVMAVLSLIWALQPEIPAPPLPRGLRATCAGICFTGFRSILLKILINSRYPVWLHG